MTTKISSNKARTSGQQGCIRAREDFMCIQRPEKQEGVESTEESQAALDVLEIIIVAEAISRTCTFLALLLLLF